MLKIVINTSYGGFGLSQEAKKSFAERKGLSTENIRPWEIKRDDPDLIAVIEDLEDNANSRFSTLEIVEIPDDIEWEIEEYDGLEWVAEVHRTWR